VAMGIGGMSELARHRARNGGSEPGPPGPRRALIE
jgi:hypothetical protein